MTMENLAFARIATLLGAVLTALSCGTNYAYSAYAPQLGSRLHMTHTQLNIVGLAGNMGVYTTGPFFGRLTDKKGPRPPLLMAVFLLFTGYTGLRAYYNSGMAEGEMLPITSLVMMSIFLYMTGAGGNAGLSASSNATAKSFPERLRATTVGFVISGFGLSAFLFSTLAHSLFPDNTSLLLLFFSLGTSIPVIIGFLTIRPVPHDERPNAGPGGLTFPADPDAADSSTRLLASDGPNGRREEEAIHPEPRSRSFELSPARSSGENRRPSRGPRSWTKPFMPSDQIDLHGKHMLLGWEFWILFGILSLLSGTGLMYMNNVGSISQALSAHGNPDYDRIKAAKVQAAQVSIISLANCAARIGFGVSADFAKNKYAVHRSYFLTLVSILFIISQIVSAQVEDVDHLWQASVILGLGYGGVFSLLPTITIEWFGLPHFSENWGFVSLGPLLGGNIFSILFGRNLDAHVPDSKEADELRHAQVDDKGHQCLEGRACYAGAMGITIFACVLGLLLSFLAAWRDRRRASLDHKFESVAQEVIWEDNDE